MIEFVAMPREFFDPPREQQSVILVDAATLLKAERMIESCEHCNPVGAEIPFDNILDQITGSDPSVTDYILETPAKCPNCKREIFEKTLIEPWCVYAHKNFHSSKNTKGSPKFFWFSRPLAPHKLH